MEARKFEREAELLSKVEKMEPAVNLRLQTAAMYRMKAKALEFEARLEDLHLWVMKKRKGRKKYTYWMATWREDGRVKNVYLGSTRKVTREQALEKARKLKARALERMKAGEIQGAQARGREQDNMGDVEEMSRREDEKND